MNEKYVKVAAGMAKAKIISKLETNQSLSDSSLIDSFGKVKEASLEWVWYSGQEFCEEYSSSIRLNVTNNSLNFFYLKVFSHIFTV